MFIRFVKKLSSGFVIIVIYVDNLNIVETQKQVDDAQTHLKKELEMKDGGKNLINVLRKKLFV